MNRYVNLILISMLLFVLSPVAWAGQVYQQVMEVTNVSELHQLQTTYKNVPEKREVCYRRNSQGLLEEITDKGFGSTKGLFGALLDIV